MNQDQSEREEDYGETCFEFYDQSYGSVEPRVIDTLQQLAGFAAADLAGDKPGYYLATTPLFLIQGDCPHAL